MKKKLLRAKLATVVAAFSLAFSIFAFGAINQGSVAWFASYREVKGSGLSIQLRDVEGVVEKTEYFAVTAVSLVEETVTDADGNEKTVTHNKYTFDVSTPLSNPALARYSPLEPLRQVLVKITLKENSVASTLTAMTSASAYPSFVQDSTSDGNFSLSSVVEFYAVVSGTANVTDDGSTCVIDADEEARFGHFTTMTANDQGVITGASLGTTSLDLCSTPYSAEAIYIIIDYYEDSADYFVEQVNDKNIAGDKVEDGIDIVSFLCDFILWIG